MIEGKAEYLAVTFAWYEPIATCYSVTTRRTNWLVDVHDVTSLVAVGQGKRDVTSILVK